MALDQFWLKVNNQKDEARKVIKMYFENIEAANQLFSGHKSGWRTDRGMVMSIYGPPEIVYRNWDTEIWQYPKSTRNENQELVQRDAHPVKLIKTHVKKRTVFG